MACEYKQSNVSYTKQSIQKYSSHSALISQEKSERKAGQSNIQCI